MQFYRKKITTIFVPYVFFTGIYTILAGRVFISEDIEPTSTPGMLNAIPSNLLNGSSWGHLWYPPILLVLFILTPLIYKSLKHPAFQYTLIITAFAPLTISRVWPDFSLNNVCFFGGAYSLGLYIGLYYQKALELFHRFSFALLLSALMLLLPIGYLYQYSPALNLPFNLIESLSYLQKIFLGCFLIEWLHRTQKPTNKIFNFIATHAYGIYLVHPAISIFAAVKKDGWDGEWFLRAYDYYGKKVGSNENEEGKIFIESQGFCGMAGIGLDDGLVKKSMDSVKEHLDCEYGIVLNQPAFTKYVVEYGEISTYPAGYKENAGIFCHNNPWIMIAETLIGDGDRAFDYWAKITPAFLEEISDLHKVEPYVYAQMIAGKDAFKPGEAKNAWLTGTAAWNFVAITQYILGVKPDYSGLSVNPCIPKDWDGFNFTRKFRGATYNITVKNPEHVSKGVKSLTVNGTAVEGCVVPTQEAGSTVDVQLVMG
jgi:hypothetical protein